MFEYNQVVSGYCKVSIAINQPPLLLLKYGQQQLCVPENGEEGDSAQLIFQPHEPLECQQN